MIRVLFFGPVAERVGRNAMQVEYRSGMQLQELREQLAAQYPQAFDIVCFVAANGEHVRDLTLPLADGSEVAFMAKFSGG
ncbi:MAG TPA: MoaD/ThiS family protein [Sideroxyarcus sp.]|nr:MoaD/ThiS family protein [Sideroxyarcus sp.]